MTDNDQLAVLWEERAISRLLLKFGRCLDVGDWAGWRDCFTDVVIVDFKRLLGLDEFRIDAQSWADIVGSTLGRVRRHHTYTNIVITLDGEQAHAKVYMTARHWASTDLGVSHNTQYGWYDFYLTRRDGDWLVEKYKHDFEWIDGNAGVLDVNSAEAAEMAQGLIDAGAVQAAKDHPVAARPAAP